MSGIVLNFALFQLTWFASVYCAAISQPLVGPVCTLSWMALHLYYVRERRHAELQLIVLAALAGYLLDSLQVLTGAISFPAQTQLGGPSPLWMVALWINLAATLNFSMKWLRGRFALATVMGAIFGPLAYFAGSELGAIELYGRFSMLMIALQWSLAMPLLLWLATTTPVLQPEALVINKAKREI